MITTTLLGIIGTAAFAFSGYLVGYRKRLDMLGVIIVALLPAIGGGLVRDVVIGRTPQVFTEYINLIVVAITLLVSWLLHLERRDKKILHNLFIITDSIGLVAFSLTGAQVGLLFDLNLFGVASLAFVTAVGGGIMRDILVNDMPVVLQKDFYGTVAILLAVAVFILGQLDWLNNFTLNVLFITGLSSRLLAHYLSINLPKF
jgi:uncharacterized membrane protein YeiH